MESAEPIIDYVKLSFIFLVKFVNEKVQHFYVIKLAESFEPGSLHENVVTHQRDAPLGT